MNFSLKDRRNSLWILMFFTTNRLISFIENIKVRVILLSIFNFSLLLTFIFILHISTYLIGYIRSKSWKKYKAKLIGFNSVYSGNKLIGSDILVSYLVDNELKYAKIESGRKDTTIFCNVTDCLIAVYKDNVKLLEVYTN